MAARLFFYVRFFVVAVCSMQPAFAQDDVRTVDMRDLNRKKANHELNGSEYYINHNALHNSFRVTPPAPSAQSSSTSCNCWLQRDASWQIGQFDASGANGGPGSPPLYRNDDWSTDTVNLPFNFCFYGAPVTKVFINNNGNISIGSPYSTFTATGFPSASFVMIAPFWGDVDTRGAGSGLVYYKLTPTYLAVQWDQVGYFDSYDDKLNTFQLIISDGVDSILPVGQNTSFCYKDMQWTTGDASDGVDGFGGTPATVGVNKGNGTDFIQIGRYDTAGTAYDGPFGSNDGVSSLDNQSFYFNVCFSGTNVPPLVNSVTACDTLQLCVGDTLIVPVNYLSPEQTQITTAALDPNSMTGASVLSNIAGNTAQIVVQLVGVNADIGFHSINITGTDDGAPAMTTNTPIVVNVLPNAVSGFTFLPASPVQTGTIVTFTNTSTPGLPYTWNFGDGTPTVNDTNPVHQFNTPGLFIVSLTTANPNGCTNTFYQQIQVNSCIGATILTAGTVCQGAPLQVSYSGNAGPLTNFNWDFDGGTIVSGSGIGPYMISWSAPGNYNISLTVTDPLGCVANAVPVPVVVDGAPVAGVAGASAVCPLQSDIISFSGAAPAGATYSWNFGGAVVSSGSGSGPYDINWNVSGNDIIRVIVSSNGCSDTADFPVVINPVPTSPFNIPLSVCEDISLPVTYTGSASAAAIYNWNFSGALVVGPAHGPLSIVWFTSGVYPVSLVVTENGCVSPVTNALVTVNANPVASIIAAPVQCSGDTNTVSFTGTALPVANYTWDFGSAGVISGTGGGPYSVRWNTAMTDTINLIVSQNGCTDTAQFSVLINPIPSSFFVNLPFVCIDHPTTIAYLGGAPASATYDWDFDGATIISGSGQGPYSLSWDSAFAPQINLVVTQNGCVSPVTNNSLIVSALPPADAGPDNEICSGTQAQIGSPSQAGLTYQWSPGIDLADSTSSSTSFPTSILSSVQVRTYILRTINPYGCINKDTVSITIDPTPVVDFNPQPEQCLNGNRFTFSAGGNLVAGAQYTWSFGSNAVPVSSNLQNPSAVTYTSPGVYRVTLDAAWNTCPAVQHVDDVTVYESPVADFRPSVYEGCVPLEVSFTNRSIGNGNSYSWNFSDNPRDTGLSPVHTFFHDGVYTVALFATTINGCPADTAFVDLITVHPLPVAAFETSPAVAPLWESLFSFQNSSSGGEKFSWDFGDGGSSREFNPTHSYTDTGTYEIILYVTSHFGCLDTINGRIRVEPEFTFYIPNSFTPNGDGVNDAFQGYGTFVKSYRMYIFNRWGKIIYTTTDYDKPWDGTVDDPVQNDVYVYKILVTDLKDKPHEYIGHVTMVR